MIHSILSKKDVNQDFWINGKVFNDNSSSILEYLDNHPCFTGIN